MFTQQLTGNACDPNERDLIAQSVEILDGEKPPGYDGQNCGWRVVEVYKLAGITSVVWWRVARRYEVTAHLRA